jgi:transcriptional regulator with XRE-family HTH domain
MYKVFMGKFVPKISELRTKMNLTQRELADAVGVTESTIANWEKGRSATEWFVRVDRLCKALSVDPNDLYEEMSILDRLDGDSIDS